MKRWIVAMLMTAAASAAVAEESRLPLEDLGEMAAGRQRLEAALDFGARERHGELAARAEARFECWTAAIEAAGGGEAYDACRDGFLVTIAALERLQQQDGGGLIAAQ